MLAAVAYPAAAATACLCHWLGWCWLASAGAGLTVLWAIPFLYGICDAVRQALIAETDQDAATRIWA